MASDKDVLRQLRAFEWGFLSFPVSETDFAFEHDIAAHKVWGEQGEHLEATGVGSLVFNATIPFRNNIFPGPNEDWKPAILYPDGLRAFVASMYARETLTLMHPEFGPVLCKPVRVRGKYDPNKRDGIDVEATWKQTMDDPEAPDPIASSSPIEVSGIVLDLDVQAGSADALRALAPTLPPFTPDWTELLREATGLIDQAGASTRRAAAPLNQLAFRASNMLRSLDRAGTSIMTWPVKNASLRMIAATEDLQKTIEGHGRGGLKLYKVPADTTLGALAGFLHVPPTVLMRLNRELVLATVVPAGTIVRFPGSSPSPFR